MGYFDRFEALSEAVEQLIPKNPDAINQLLTHEQQQSMKAGYDRQHKIAEKMTEHSGMTLHMGPAIPTKELLAFQMAVLERVCQITTWCTHRTLMGIMLEPTHVTLTGRFGACPACLPLMVAAGEHEWVDDRRCEVCGQLSGRFRPIAIILGAAQVSMNICDNCDDYHSKGLGET